LRRLVNVAQSPVTRLLSSTAFLIAAFADGSVKVLNNELKMRVSINAHARAISSMDIDEMSGVFLTAGEDSTLCVWTVPTGEEGTVDLVMADSVPDRLVTGAKFLTDGYEEKKIVASCYDHDQVIVWNRKEND
jgi:WD40 repeat protein